MGSMDGNQLVEVVYCGIYEWESARCGDLLWDLGMRFSLLRWFIPLSQLLQQKFHLLGLLAHSSLLGMLS